MCLFDVSSLGARRTSARGSYCSTAASGPYAGSRGSNSNSNSNNNCSNNCNCNSNCDKKIHWTNTISSGAHKFQVRLLLSSNCRPRRKVSRWSAPETPLISSTTGAPKAEDQDQHVYSIP